MNWDRKWTAVSAIAAILSLFLPLVLFSINRDTKELTVETVSNAILVDLSKPELSSVKLTYNDVPVSRLSVATIEFRNSGTRPIERADFELPIVLRFQDSVDVLAVTLSDKMPNDLSPVINSNMKGISVAPLLLNPGDQFRITVQLRGNFNEPTVEARISGVPSILRRMHPASDPSRRGFLLMGIGAVLTVFYMYIAFFSIDTVLLRRPITPLPLPENIGVIFFLAGLSAVASITGAETFGLSKTQFFSGGIVFFIVAASVISPFARRRSSRLWNMLKP